jgi:hypothetical protein
MKYIFLTISFLFTTFLIGQTVNNNTPKLQMAEINNKPSKTVKKEEVSLKTADTIINNNDKSAVKQPEISNCSKLIEEDETKKKESDQSNSINPLD